MKPKPVEPTSSSSSAKIGSSTTYDEPNTEAKNDSPMIARKSGRDEMKRKPTITPLCAAEAGAVVRAGSRIVSSTTTEIAIVAAATKNACPVPTNAIRIPLSAGPTTRIAPQTPLFSATALDIASRSISLGSSALIEGAESAANEPVPAAQTTTIQSETTSVTINTASTK